MPGWWSREWRARCGDVAAWLCVPIGAALWVVAAHAQDLPGASAAHAGESPSSTTTAQTSVRSSIDLLGEDPVGDDDASEATPSETGLVSWYGPGFHRRRTASGERFDMHALTAAHRTLPFGTLVCVRSQATGREVVVRINDRGPHVANRVMDLSRGAAMALGMHGLGLKPVDVFPLNGDDTTCPPKRAD